MNYIDKQIQLIKEYSISHIPDSKCWSRMHAHCEDGSRRICKHRIINSYKALFDLCHEIGHIETNKNGMKRCEQESEATLWCIRKLKELGFPVKRKYVNQYKEYIRLTYNRGIKRGLQKRIKSKLYI